MSDEKNQGVQVKVIGKKLTIKVPIDTLVYAFENHPDNCNEDKVKNKKKFAESVARHIEMDEDQEAGLTDFHRLLDNIFNTMQEDADESIKFGDE
jgi:hypothetical protein